MTTEICFLQTEIQVFCKRFPCNLKDLAEDSSRNLFCDMTEKKKTFEKLSRRFVSGFFLPNLPN